MNLWKAQLASCDAASELWVPGDRDLVGTTGCTQGAPRPVWERQVSWGASKLKQGERHSKLSQGFTAPHRVSAPAPHSVFAFRLLLRIGCPPSAPLRGTVRRPSDHRHLLRIGSAPAKLLSAPSQLLCSLLRFGLGTAQSTISAVG